MESNCSRAALGANTASFARTSATCALRSPRSSSPAFPTRCAAPPSCSRPRKSWPTTRNSSGTICACAPAAPRCSTSRPPDVHEFDSPAMHRALADLRREFSFDLRQVEYTHLAGYGGDILVEHDVTFDLFHQVLRRERSLAALWDFLRWRRYE